MTGKDLLKSSSAPISIIEACGHPQIFAPWFKNRETWAAWFAFIKAIFGIPLDDAELAIFRTFTGLSAPRPGGYLDASLIVGRRGGKSLILALIAAYLAAFVDWTPFLTGGERGTIMIVAGDLKQGRAIFRYLKEMLSVPLLAGLIERETLSSLDLTNGITIEILAANFRTVRSYTLVACLADELATWPTDEGSANPDTEILAAIRPAMATIPKAMLLQASSPYARRGELWEDYQRYFGKEASLASLNADLHLRLSTMQKIHGAGNLRKRASADDLGENMFAVRNLLKVMSEKMTVISKLQAACRESQRLAVAALPSYAKFYSNGLQDTVPNRTYFSADKGAASPTPLAMPSQQSSVPMASIADAARRR